MGFSYTWQPARNFVAEAAVSQYRIVKFGASDTKVIQASATTAPLIGITDTAQDEAGKGVDIWQGGIHPIEYGGTVTRGAMLTSDSIGRGIAAAPSAGTNAYIIGQAQESGVVGQIGSCLIQPGTFQG
jgi:hypothetical protein